MSAAIERAGSMRGLGGRGAVAVWCVAALALAGAVVAGLLVGPAALDAGAIWQGLVGAAGSNDATLAAIVHLRALRTAGAGLTGACLGLAGLLLQSTTRNPLADPYLLGTSAGATLAVVAATTLAGGLGLAGVLGPLEPLLALGGALAASFVAFRVGAGAGGSPERVVLAGLVLTAFAGAAASLLLYRADDASLRAATQWLMGGVVVTSASSLALPALVVAVATAWAVRAAAGLDALWLGSEAARGVGVDTERLERGGTWLAAALTAFAVAIAGIVGFVGLLVPHGARALVGGDHRRLVPATALGGGAFLILVDVLCRVAMAPAELPIGIPTALGGVPVLIALIGGARAGLRMQAPARRPADAGAVAPVAHDDDGAGAARPTPPTLRVRGLGVGAGDAALLEGVDLDADAGELVVVVGPTGAGKSTLLRALAGATPSSGSVAFAGYPRPPGNAAQPEALSWLPQRVELPRGATVAELVALPLRVAGLDAEAVRVGVDAALARCAMAAMAERALTTLSGGQLQRALLAMALCRPTPLVLLDEPTAALDVVSAHAVLADLATLARAEGRVVVVASHDLHAAVGVADRIVAVRDGRVVRSARGDDADDCDAALVAAFGEGVLTLMQSRARPLAPGRVLC